jgi:hypothetical protein
LAKEQQEHEDKPHTEQQKDSRMFDWQVGWLSNSKDRPLALAPLYNVHQASMARLCAAR